MSRWKHQMQSRNNKYSDTFIFKILTILLLNQGYKTQSVESLWNVFNFKCFQKITDLEIRFGCLIYN